MVDDMNTAVQTIRGKVLLVECVKQYIGRGRHLFVKTNGGVRYFASVKGWKYSWTSCFSLTRRLFRADFTGLYKLSGNVLLLVAKKGLFINNETEKRFVKCFSIPRGSRPLNICVSPAGNIFFGEYFQNEKKSAVNIYSSDDNGRTWHVIYTFPPGNINHVHGVFYDIFTNRIWVVTGDRENECIIGYTENEFKTFVVVFRGGQEFRTCQLFFYKDFIVFGTDSQYQQNVLKKVDRKSLKITELQKLQGSVIKGGQVGDIAFVATTVEPSKVNTDKWAHLWITKDGVHWEEKYKAKKDWLPAVFQFATFEFPIYYCMAELKKLLFSGRALNGHDGKAICIDI